MKYVCLKPTFTHGGGSTMLWECLTANGVSDLVRSDGIMNVEKYRPLQSPQNLSIFLR